MTSRETQYPLGMETLPDVQCFFCGRRVRDVGHVYLPRWQPHFLLEYICEGTATFASDQARVRLAAGQLLALFPGQTVTYAVDPGVAWTIYWVGLSGEMVESTLARIGVTREQPALTLAQPALAEASFVQLYMQMQGATYADRLRCMGTVYALLAAVSEGGAAQTSERYAAQTLRIIENNYPYELTLERIARSVNLDPCYLARLFKRQTGRTIMACLQETRLQAACRLLRDTDRPVREIATSVGFADALYFTRLFHRCMGCAPTVFRDAERSPSFPAAADMQGFSRD